MASVMNTMSKTEYSFEVKRTQSIMANDRLAEVWCIRVDNLEHYDNRIVLVMVMM